MKKYVFFALSLCFPMWGFATTDGQCTPVPLLQQGLNIDHYKKCATLIRQCPKQGPVTNENCVYHMISENPVCNQLNSLSQKLNTSAASITVKQVAKFNIITQTYIADGQEHYFILTPNGCLIDTVVDPRKLNNKLNKQYKTSPFMILNWGQPRYQLNRDGSHTFITLLKVTDSCRACALIGWANVQFHFTKEGTLTNVELESFKKRW